MTPNDPKGPTTPASSAPESPNQTLLDEVNQGGTWFHAKKTRPIWARLLQQAQKVKTLEGEEDVPAGNFLCRGEAGDLWPQTPQQLEKRYTPSDEVDGEGWRKYLPHPDAQGVMAAQVNHSFQVIAQWGRLSGKAGDYVVKNFTDRDIDYPADVWIVDQTLFQQTYEPVTDPE